MERTIYHHNIYQGTEPKCPIQSLVSKVFYLAYICQAYVLVFKKLPSGNAKMLLIVSKTICNKSKANQRKKVKRKVEVLSQEDDQVLPFLV